MFVRLDVGEDERFSGLFCRWWFDQGKVVGWLSHCDLCVVSPITIYFEVHIRGIHIHPTSD